MSEKYCMDDIVKSCLFSINVSYNAKFISLVCTGTYLLSGMNIRVPSLFMKAQSCVGQGLFINYKL